MKEKVPILILWLMNASKWKFKIKLIIILIILICSLPCFPQKKNYIILTGKIENLNNHPNGKKTISLSLPFYLGDISKTIQVTADGSFCDTIKTGEGLYCIFDGSNPVSLYLRKSKTYSIYYNADSFRNNGRVILSGDDTAINRYFIEQEQKRIFIDRLNFGRSENEFRQLMADYKKQKIKRLQNSKLPPKLKRDEEKNIQYEYLSELIFFLAEKEENEPSFKPSKISENELNINYNNEQEYKKYDYYNKLVYQHYQVRLEKLQSKFKFKDSLYSLQQHIIKLLNSIVPDKYIKNDLIKQDVRFYFKEAKDKEAFYNDFKKYYTGNDVELKEQMIDDYLRFSKLKRGTPSPEFTSYLNLNGGYNSLADFRGHYVFIDIWASWCGNCWVELPYLKNLEEDYKNKNIS